MLKSTRLLPTNQNALTHTLPLAIHICFTSERVHSLTHSRISLIEIEKIEKNKADIYNIFEYTFVCYFAVCLLLPASNFPRARARFDELNPIATIYTSSIFCGHNEINHFVWVGNICLRFKSSSLFLYLRFIFVAVGLGYKKNGFRCKRIHKNDDDFRRFEPLRSQNQNQTSHILFTLYKINSLIYSLRRRQRRRNSFFQSKTQSILHLMD